MKKWISLSAAAALCAGMLLGCGEAKLPFMAQDFVMEYDITSPYTFQWRSSGSEPMIGYEIPVNPMGIAIKQVKSFSDGSVAIILGGTSVINGIPDGLRQVYWPYTGVTGDISGSPSPGVTSIKTDYPVTGVGLPTSGPFMFPFTDVPIEDMISLKKVNQNAKYTAVTISGMVGHDRFIDVREENESLRLLTQYYIDGYNANSALYNTNRYPMYRGIVYYQDPNFFSNSGFNPIPPVVYRGPQQGQRGGFNVLIWDGANPKQATFNVSYDNGRTFKKTTVDWNAVQFKNVALTNVKWVEAPPGIVNSQYALIAVSGTSSPYAATITLDQYTQDHYFPPRTSIAEGGQPQFTPANATVKRFYFTGSGTVRDGVYYGSGVAAELGDRVRVWAIKGAGTVTGETIDLCIDVVDPSGSPATITLRMTVNVT